MHLLGEVSSYCCQLLARLGTGMNMKSTCSKPVETDEPAGEALLVKLACLRGIHCYPHAVHMQVVYDLFSLIASPAVSNQYLVFNKVSGHALSTGPCFQCLLACPPRVTSALTKRCQRARAPQGRPTYGTCPLACAGLPVWATEVQPAGQEQMDPGESARACPPRSLLVNS